MFYLEVNVLGLIIELTLKNAERRFLVEAGSDPIDL